MLYRRFVKPILHAVSCFISSMFLRSAFFFFFTHLFIYTLEIVYQYLKYIHYFIMNFVIFCKCFFFSLIFVHNKKNLQKMFAKIIDGICIVCVKLYMYRKHEKWILLKNTWANALLWNLPIYIITNYCNFFRTKCTTCSILHKSKEILMRVYFFFHVYIFWTV